MSFLPQFKSLLFESARKDPWTAVVGVRRPKIGDKKLLYEFLVFRKFYHQHFVYLTSLDTYFINAP